jgi:trimethylamine--corrinoid protein Co-methyltransferase
MEQAGRLQPRRGGGRAARLRQRSAGPAERAVGPGLKGGSYRPLGERDLLRIHETALDVLENIGIGGALPEILDLALPRGCRLNDAGRLCFPRGFVEDAIAGACHGFTLHAPDPDLGIELGGTRVHYATSGEAVTVYEPETRTAGPLRHGAPGRPAGEHPPLLPDRDRHRHRRPLRA